MNDNAAASIQDAELRIRAVVEKLFAVSQYDYGRNPTDFNKGEMNALEKALMQIDMSRMADYINSGKVVSFESPNEVGTSNIGEKHLDDTLNTSYG